MLARLTPQLLRYGRALIAVLIALALSLLLRPIIERVPFILFFAAVVFSAGYGGIAPGILAAVLSILVVDYFFFVPINEFHFSPSDLPVFILFFLISWYVSSLYQRRLTAEARAQNDRDLLRVTLSSIGDGVIAVDLQGHVTLINSAAEALTGWHADVALGKPIVEVLRVINEQTRQPIDIPIYDAFQERKTITLANHAVLITKAGAERDIEDSAAALHNGKGELTGTVLTFRDISERRHNERLVHQHASRTQQLQRVTAALGELVKSEDVARVIVERSIQAVDDAYGALVAVLVEDSDVLEILYHSGYSNEAQARFKSRRVQETSPLTDVVRKKTPVFIESKEAWSAQYPDQDALVTSQSLALLPLLVSDRSIGGMAVSFNSNINFSPEDRAFLIALSQQCAQALDRARLFDLEAAARTEAEQARKQAVDTLESIDDAFVALDNDWRFIYANHKAERLLARWSEPLLGKLAWDVFPDTATEMFRQEAQRARDEQMTREFEQFFAVTRDWYVVRIYPSPQGITAYFQDITARKRAEIALQSSQSRLQRFIESNIVGIIFATNGGLIVGANDAFLKMVGYTRAELEAGQVNWMKLTPAEYLSADAENIRQVDQTSAETPREGEYIHKDGRRISVLLGGTLVDDTWITFVVNITERKRAERRLRTLTKASTLLASSLDYKTTLTSVTRLMVPDMADWCTVHIQQAGGDIQQLSVAHIDPEKVMWADEIQRRYPADPTAQQGLYQVIRSGKAEFYPEITDEMLVAAARGDSELLKILREIGYTSLMILPLTARGRTLGALQLVSAELRERYTTDDQALAEDLARRVGVAIDNARLYTEMRDQRERLQVTLASIGDAVIATDVNGQVTFMNAVAQDLVGWNQADAIDKPLETVFRIINAETRHTVESPVSKVIREGAIVGMANHTLLIARNGQEIPIDDSGAPIRNEDGLIDGVILVFRDVTQQKRAADNQRFLVQAGTLLAESLDEAKTFDKLAHLIVPHLADNCAIDIVEEHNSIRRVAVAASPEKEEILREIMRRYPPHASQITVEDVIKTQQPLFVVEVTEALIASFAQDADEAELIRSIGTRSSMRLPLVAREHVIGLISIGMAESGRTFDDEKRSTAQELVHISTLALENIRLFNQARQAIEIRNEFLSIAAHELKTPLTSLRGYAQTLLRHYDKRGTIDPEQLQRALVTIDAQSSKLAKLVNQLLDLSRLEAGRLALERQPTDLKVLVTEVVTTLQKNTQIHHIAVHMPDKVEALVDPLRLEQVLVNLLDNAIKYSPQGGPISVNVSAEEARDIQITVSDKGIGIPVDRRGQIFERFYQAHSEGYLGGMGLGLYVSRQIVELHGGSLEAEFPSDGGTRLVISLPYAVDIVTKS